MLYKITFIMKSGRKTTWTGITEEVYDKIADRLDDDSREYVINGSAMLEKSGIVDIIVNMDV